jgi:LmbE family N-acetylglucosaminyl deacetylase
LNGDKGLEKITRRKMLERSSLFMASMGAGIAQTSANAEPCGAIRRQKIVVVGAHPDDPESGCGGAIALYADQGHDVVIFYLTRGETGIKGVSMQETAAIRTAEAEKACAILKARPVFVGQVNGQTEVNRSRYEEFRKLLDAENPDVVFTHWPIDTHRDHRVASLLVYDAWLEGGKIFDLYYFEVDQGLQTQIFHPTHYVDIAQSVSRKQAACYAHASQHPVTDFWPLHEAMDRFRGMECGVKDAEGYVAHCQNLEMKVPIKL